MKPSHLSEISFSGDLTAVIPQIKPYTKGRASRTALEAFDQHVIIIAGGYDKDLPFDELGQKIATNAKAAILLGQTAPKIADAIHNAKMSLRAKKAFRPERSRRESNLNKRDTRHEIRDTKIEVVDSLANAVQLANRLAVSGDVVLLSPACASYDMFDNFQHRGQEFIKHVRALNTDRTNSQTQSA